MNIVVASFLVAIGMAVIHLFAGRLRFLEGIPRSIWLSTAGGVSVAYVFAHLLPMLDEWARAVAVALAGMTFLEHHVYVVALCGVVVFYGLERAAQASRENRSAPYPAAHPGKGVFWLHIASFAVYNALIGYVFLHPAEHTLKSLAFFAVAIGLHFVVNDYGLRDHYKELYEQRGRWVLAASILLGWVAGLVIKLPIGVVAIILALLAGGIILNTLKEELPAERESRIWPFAAGAAAYTIVLLAA